MTGFMEIPVQYARFDFFLRPPPPPPFMKSGHVTDRLKKKILCLKAAARICFSVRIWFCKIQTFIFFLLK